MADKLENQFLRRVDVRDRRTFYILMSGFTGLVFATNLGNWAYDIVIEPDKFNRTNFMWLLLVTTMSGLATLLFGYLYFRATRINAYIQQNEYQQLPQFKGLIWFPTPRNHDLIDWILLKSEGEIQHVWALVQNSESMLQVFDDLETTLEKYANITLHLVKLSDTDAESVFVAIRGVFAGLPEGLSASDLMIDITGGTSLMTTGAALAGATYGWRIMYVASEYDARGNRINSEHVVTTVDLNFARIRASELN